MVSILTKIKTSLRLTNQNYTPVCRPPEDIFKFQSDIWSLGVTLYYMAEMVYPFGEESEKDIKDNILNKIPKINYNENANKRLFKKTFSK